jgi:HEPN domain-containing protein
MSKVLESGAEGLARFAAEEIVRDAVKARLKERLGPKLEALGRLVADRIADDIEASLDIEARIDARRVARRASDGQIASIFRGGRDGGDPQTHEPGEPGGLGDKP